MSLLISLAAAAEGHPGRSGAPPVPPAKPGGGRSGGPSSPGGGGRRGLRAAARCLLQNSLEAKDGSGSAHAGIAPAAAYYPYDHTLSQYQYDR